MMQLSIIQGIRVLFASSELYDPATEIWTATGSMNTARHSHTSTLLSHGKVLVAGGDNYISNVFASAELYDPVTGVWTNTSPMATARSGHTAILLSSGKVLVMGGFKDYFSNALASAEIYDPSSGMWSYTAPMTTARVGHSAVLLANGKVLVSGGGVINNGNFQIYSSAELYDFETGTWTPIESMNAARGMPHAELLHNGQVLVAGGGYAENGASLTSAELYVSSFSCAATLSPSLLLHVPILMYDGQSYWADFQYIYNTMDFFLINIGPVTDISSFGDCVVSPSLPISTCIFRC